MALFKPGMFRRRVEHEAKPKEQDTPASPPVVECTVCNSQDHTHDTCPSIIRPGETERTWRSGGYPDGSSGHGDTFDEIREFFRRFRGGRE